MISNTETPGVKKYIGRTGYFANDEKAFGNLLKRATRGTLEDIKDGYFLYNNQKFKFFMPLPT